MKTRSIGTSSLLTTRLAYGCMRLSQGTAGDPTPEVLEKGKAAVRAAFEAGFRLFDHADIYGRNACETIFGAVMREEPRLRDRMVIATKCGIRFPGQPTERDVARYDFSAAYIVRSCEGSLKRLGIETIDLYQLHRPDALMDPCEVAAAFDLLRRQGKVREFGVSNFTTWQFRALQ